MPMVKITNVINEKNKMRPSKEVENSLKAFARSYHSVFLKSLDHSIKWVDN